MVLTQFLPMDSYYHGILAATGVLQSWLIIIFFRWLGANVGCFMLFTGMLWWPLPTQDIHSLSVVTSLTAFGLFGSYCFLALAGNKQRLQRLGAKIHQLQLKVRNRRRLACGEAICD